MATDSEDPTADLRNQLGTLIETANAFSAEAGSPEMNQVRQAINYLGSAYSALQKKGTSGNPAWPDGRYYYDY